ncbi:MULTISPECIES: class I SAM-dependent DNA methyltransferase [Nonomuraea]|uniref:Class I SAM-dependent methyltransferase n=1 Tax=Nonomuraea ferruginea TaxID=46174 RepID=A0ABT4SY18_9ACTN|nr:MULTISPECIES: class I SAM-dependent methyltransferase [Nonomuraea]MDA0642152.1 class I SAM-dependent methyltransferase [Nonomuraea ferruginea]TXK39564.1 class I SAM-dependent methyltransferase [Nonomuraea sp. C10]
MHDFDHWAELYLAWTAMGGADPREIAYYQRLTGSADGSVADLGIGAGRLAAELKPRVGVDVSAAMLRAARERLGDGVRLIQADLAACELPEPVALQYCGQNTLNHLPRGAVRDALACAFRNALPGGRLAFEVVQPRPERQKARDGVPRLRVWDERRAVWEVTRMLDKQGLEVEMIGLLEALDERRVVDRRYFPPIRMCFLTMAEIERWAGETGWEVESAHAGFTGEPLAPGSSTAVWCLRRPA